MQTRSLLSPEPESHFKKIHRNIQESIYSRCHQKQITIPNHITNTNRVFGKQTHRDLPIKKTIFPEHDLIHCPHKNVDNNQPFGYLYPQKIYGRPYDMDFSGKYVKCAFSYSSPCNSKLNPVWIAFQSKRAIPESILQDRIFGRPSTSLSQKRETVADVLMTDYDNPCCIGNNKSFNQSIFSPLPHLRKNKKCKDVRNLGGETTVADLINPKIPMSKGLSHRDYLYPRNKEEIFTLFQNIGHQDLSLLEEIWQKCVQQHSALGSEKVSVHDFYEELRRKNF